jgi:hypothetical protein
MDRVARIIDGGVGTLVMVSTERTVGSRTCRATVRFIVTANVPFISRSSFLHSGDRLGTIWAFHHLGRWHHHLCSIVGIVLLCDGRDTHYFPG